MGKQVQQTRDPTEPKSLFSSITGKVSEAVQERVDTFKSVLGAKVRRICVPSMSALAYAHRPSLHSSFVALAGPLHYSLSSY